MKAWIAVAALLVLPGIAKAADCSSWSPCNGVISTGSFSTVVCCQEVPPAPATNKSPEENIDILLRAAKEEQKSLEERWFVSGKALAAAREKVKTYGMLQYTFPTR